MDWIQTLISLAIGAVGGALPLYFKLKNFQTKISKQVADNELEIEKKRAEHQKSNKIDTEAEWKRILEYRDAELTTLRARDEAQDRQIKDLFDKHVDCEKDKARNEARIEALERHYGDQIRRLEAELQELKNLLKGFKNVPDGTSAGCSPTGCPLLDKERHG